MTQQFTASEVRESAIAVAARDMEYEAEMLRAFADMLEAQEKAVPFGYAYRYWDGIRFDTGGREINGSKPTATIPLYTHTPTHPAPADAERLAEALRVTDEMVERACKKYAFREDGAVFPDAYSDEEVLAERVLMREFLEHVLLAARSAQAVKAFGSLGLTEEQRDAIRFRALCADYGDRAIRAKVRGLIDRLPVMSLSAARSAIDDLTRNIAQPKIGDFDARDSFTVHTNTTTLQQNAAEGAQAQPPAARVTDEYQEIARLIGSIFCAGGFKAETWNERELERLLKKTGNWFDNVDQVPKPLLAAQETKA